MILMVIMVVLGISGMDDTAMQERMSGNLRNRDIAFQAAESALRQGEAWLQANAPSVSANPRITGLASQNWDPANGVGPAPSGVLAGLYAGNPVINLAADPVFYVGPPELLRINPGETPPEFREIHPVVARSVGANDNTLVILRSTFEPL
jgi:type IV pilus assembly protein PilX